MSPKNSSLAFEDKEQTFQEMEIEFVPELSLVKGRLASAADEDLIQVSGHVTISF